MSKKDASNTTKRIGKSQEIIYAGFFIRILASVIDTVLSAILLAPIISILIRTFNIPNARETLNNTLTSGDIITDQIAFEAFIHGLPSSIFQLVVISMVVLILWHYKSATPGKLILKMKIVDSKTNSKPTNTQFIIRYLGYIISTIPFGLGFIWIFYDKKHQGWHDKLAGTAVVRKKFL